MRKNKIITTTLLLIACIVPITIVLVINHNKDRPKKAKQSVILRGYDISHYNKIEDWDKVSADFIFIKATEGSTLKDKKFNEYKRECRKRNIKVGAYHFFTTSTSPELQFKNFYNTVGYDIDISPVIDIERFTKGFVISDKLLKKRVRVFVDLCIEKYNKPPIIYCSKLWYKRFFSNGFEDCYYWNSNVYSKCNIKHDVKQTKIDYAKGFKNKIDHDIIYNKDVMIDRHN